MRNRYAATFVSVLVAALSLAVPAMADDANVEQLKEQVRQLQARVQTLENSKHQSANNDQVRATVQDVINDAERRSKLLATGDGELTAGYEKGFFIRSADGNFSLRPSVLFQFRNVSSIRTGDDDDFENGFEFRRLRPRIEGNLFSPDFTYSVVLDASRSTGSISLLDAWVQYKFAPTWAIKGGQFRNSWVHEGDVPDSNQLAVERSLVDALLAGSQTDRVQGVSLIYGAADVPVRVEVAYHDGANSKNTNFQDINTDFGTSGRIEYKVFGNWADYRDFSARTNKQDLLVIGAGADWTELAGADVLRTTVDAQYETASHWAFYAELNGNVIRDNNNDNFDWGALGQVGYAINPVWEPFFRYDVVVIDKNGQDAFNEFTVGVNYYLGENGSAGHRAKFTVDVLYLPEGAPSDQTGAGVLASDEAEFVLRGQFQLVL